MTERPLARRHAVVTGGGRGIGAAVALELARLGADVSVMPNGIDLDLWAPNTLSEGRGRPGERGPLRLVSTMRLAPRKRAVPLVELVGQAARRLPPDRLRLSIIGSGPAQGRVASAVLPA